MGNDGNDLPVLQYTINKKSGFGLPADLDENSKGLLLIEVHLDNPMNRLLTINFDGTVREIYRSVLIGSALFLTAPPR